MRKKLKSLSTFVSILRIMAFFSKRSIFDRFTFAITKKNAKLNIRLNNPTIADNVSDLAKTWKQLMPSDGQHLFKITELSENTAYAEIHLHCPLRGTGNVEACHKLMNYDRTLMEKVGGELVVLESQSNSGKNYCSLAIREKGENMSDLIPAHKITSYNNGIIHC